MPGAERVAKADQHHRMCEEIFDYYVSAIEHDMNQHVQKRGEPMDMTFAHHDITRIFMKDIEPGNLAGIVAYAVLREIRRKAQGRG